MRNGFQVVSWGRCLLCRSLSLTLRGVAAEADGGEHHRTGFETGTLRVGMSRLSLAMKTRRKSGGLNRCGSVWPGSGLKVSLSDAWQASSCALTGKLIPSSEVWDHRRTQLEGELHHSIRHHGMSICATRSGRRFQER